MGSMEKAAMSSIRGLGSPPQPLHNKRDYWKQPRDTSESWDSSEMSHEGDSSWCPSPSSLCKGWQKDCWKHIPSDLEHEFLYPL